MTLFVVTVLDYIFLEPIIIVKNNADVNNGRKYKMANKGLDCVKLNYLKPALEVFSRELRSY